MRENLRLGVQVVFCGWLAFFCSFIDRLSWPPVIPLATIELEISAAQAGGFMSAFFFGYLLTQLPGGILADRFGTRIVVLVSLALMGIFTISITWVPGYGTGILMRFLAGIGSGAILAASVKGVFDHFGPEQRATAMGFFMTSAPLGLLAANILAPFLAAGYGWRISFFVAGIITLLSFAFSWLILPIGASHSATLATKKTGIRRTLATLLANRNLMIAAAAGFFAMWGTWGTLTWANAYINKVLGLSLQQSGQAMALFGLGALIGQPIAGRLSDLFPDRRRQAGMLILGCFAVLLVLFGNNQSVVNFNLLVILLGAASFVFGPVLNTFISELVDPWQVATAIGLCNSIWQLGSLISPLVAGMLLDHTGSFIWAFSALAAGPVVAVLLLAMIRKPIMKKS